MANRDAAEAPTLTRGLGTWDGALITIGAVIGSGIFITTSDIARALPHPGWILLIWVVGGLLTLAGALTYAELGALYPEAGGIYHFLKEGYGPLWGFLYGWACFLIIMSGGIAALAVAFGEYSGSFLPFFSTQNILLSLPIAGWSWTLSGGQVAAVAAIVVLTAVNYLGVKEGALLQNILTVLKIGAILGFIGLGLFKAPQTSYDLTAPLPPINLLTAFGVGMIGALWTYDGWYGLTFSAGEMRDPARGLPLGLILGTITIMILYVLLNMMYIRALPIEAMGQTSRIGETAAVALLGPQAARLVSLAVLISTFGCLSCTILYSSRIYLPMAQDGVFFRAVASIHPRYHTPGVSLWAQSSWAALLTLSGSYEQIYTYVIFAAVLFHVMTGAAVFVLRRTRPELPRPYKTWGYPVVPALFILASVLLLANTLSERPTESLLGLGLVAIGLPAYLWWRKRGQFT